MFWSYLADSKSLNTPNPKLLTFESHESHESYNVTLKKLSDGYCELIVAEFFSSFANDYDSVFISKFSPDTNPSKNEFEFFLKFNDVEKAKNILANN